MKWYRGRLKGWRLARFIERHRYVLLCQKIRRRNYRMKDKGIVPRNTFKLLIGEESFAEICRKRRELNVGGTLVVCPKGSLIVRLPIVFDFEKNYVESAMVVALFRRAVASRVKISYINFEMVQQISPACIMVFMAYADLWKAYAPNVQTKTQTWAPAIVRAFKEIGFFARLGFRPPREDVSHKGERSYMPIIARSVILGSSVDVGHVTIDIQKQIEDYFDINLDGVRLYDSVTEAISNVYGHAYKGVSAKTLPFYWWMSVSYDVRQSELGVILFDHGQGIPSTMKNSTKFDLYRQIINRVGGDWSESFRLSVAFERERRKNRGNKSLISGRGHGCRDMLRLVSQEDQNEIKEGSAFNVISGRAKYHYEERENHGRGIPGPLNVKLQGTLIEWRIKL